MTVLHRVVQALHRVVVATGAMQQEGFYFEVAFDEPKELARCLLAYAQMPIALIERLAGPR